MSRLRPCAAIASAALVLVPVLCAAPAQGSPAPVSAYAPGHVLLAFKPGVPASVRGWIAREVGGKGMRALSSSIQPSRTEQRARSLIEPLLLHVDANEVMSVVKRLRRFRQVAYAEPDYLMRAAAVPNDPFFHEQWADENTGQSIPLYEFPGEEPGAPVPGAAGADERTLPAWGVTTGTRSVVIGEVDTGIDYQHPDLAANIWSNPGGLLGCKAGTHGYNVLAEQEVPLGNPCDPMDKDSTYGGHGTHVAGIMGALGNNGEGIAGVNWQTTILPVKWLQSAEPESETSKLIEALERLVAFKNDGVPLRVVNDSAVFAATGTMRSEALMNEIKTLGSLGVLFVTAAGNAGRSNDSPQHWYPCTYDLPNEICVTATNNRDELPSWANWGPRTVDLAAPGASIESTCIHTLSTRCPGGYRYLSGTSMASAQVSGAAALILSALPSLSPEELKARILSSVDRLPSVEGRVISGGRLNVCKALPKCASGPPPAPISPPTSPPAPPPAPPRATAPVITSLKLSPTVFRAARSGHASVARLRFGTQVTYRDSEAALASFTVLVPRGGVKDSGGRCVKPPSHTRPGQKLRRCIRYQATRSTFTHNDRAGVNTFRFTGRLAGTELRPGRYVLRVVPTFAGLKGTGALAIFRVVG